VTWVIVVLWLYDVDAAHPQLRFSGAYSTSADCVVAMPGAREVLIREFRSDGLIVCSEVRPERL